jgi:hypothetical protein
MWLHVGLVKKDILEECIASIFKVEGIRERRAALAVGSETLVFTRPTRRHIPEDGTLHSHCRENLKSYTDFIYTVN